MSQHLTDSFNGHTFFERNQRGERVPPHVIPEVGLQSGDDTQDFHVRPQRAVMLRGQQRFPRVVLILLYQGDGLRQQFHAGFQFVLLAPVLQPQAALVVREQVLPCHRHGVRIGGSRIAREQEQIPRDDDGTSFLRYLHIPQLLEVLPAQRLRRAFFLLGQLEMHEVPHLRQALLVGCPADLLQQGEVMPCGLVGIAPFPLRVSLVFPDELFVQSAKGDVVHLILLLDKIAQRQPCVMPRAHRGRGHVDTDTAFPLLDHPVEQAEQRHLCLHAALQQFLHRLGVEIAFPSLQLLECRVHGEQQFLYFRVCLHRLAALPVQTAFPCVPQLRGAGQFRPELRHCPVYCNSSHDGSFARLVGFGLLQVEQDLEFLNFHTPTFFVCKFTIDVSVHRYAKCCVSQKKKPSPNFFRPSG